MNLNRAVFIDRDDTINRDVPYCSHPEDFELLPTVCEGVRLLNEHGFKVVVITNQSGIARGYFTEETLRKIHQKMCEELAKCRATIDAIYFCPHHPDEHCECRKPKPTLALQAAEEMNINIRQSFVVGDGIQDVQMGKHLGCKSVLVPRKPLKDALDSQDAMPDYIATNLYEAAMWILREVEGQV